MKLLALAVPVAARLVSGAIIGTAAFEHRAEKPRCEKQATLFNPHPCQSVFPQADDPSVFER